MTRTPVQNKILHGLINAMKIDDDTKEALVMQFSSGRCSSSKDLTWYECKELIDYLTRMNRSEESRKEVVRRKMIWRLYFMLRDRGYFTDQDNPKALIHLDRFTTHIWHKAATLMNEKELATHIGIVNHWKNKKTCPKS